MFASNPFQRILKIASKRAAGKTAGGAKACFSPISGKECPFPGGFADPSWLQSASCSPAPGGQFRNGLRRGRLCFIEDIQLPGWNGYGFRADADRDSYLMRLNPNKCKYVLYFCAQKINIA